MKLARRIRDAALLSCLLLGQGLVAQTTQPARAREKPNEKLLRYAKDACKRRWVIRRQAAKRLVKAGDAGFLAIEIYLAMNGRDVLSSELVDALGDFEQKEARSLLASLVTDVKFYWRPQALMAMAKKPRASETELFRANCKSQSYLLRRAALTGLSGIDKRASVPELEQALADEDLRIRVHAAGLLLARKNAKGLPVLIGALLVEDSFFSVDYGKQVRQSAIALLKTWAGSDMDYDAAATRAMRMKVASAFQKKASEAIGEFALPSAHEAAAKNWVFGYERRACKEGDIVLRVDAEGRLWSGLFNPRPLSVSKEAIEKLGRLSRAAPSQGHRVFGRIRCDYTRLAGLGEKASFSLRAAPDAMPKAVRPLAEYWLGLAPNASK